MATFADQVTAFRRTLEQRARDVHTVAADLAHQSIVEGSPLTGAPGQPVDTGNLRASWQRLIDGPLEQRIVTNVVYAPAIEDGIRHGEVVGIGPDDATDRIKSPDTPLTLRSAVGGFHSVKLTRAGWPAIVRAAVAEVTRGS